MSYQIAIHIESSFNAQGAQTAEQALQQLGQASAQVNKTVGAESSRAANEASEAQNRLTQRLAGSRAASAAVQQTFLQMSSALAGANPLFQVSGNLMGEFAARTAQASESGLDFGGAALEKPAHEAEG